MTDSDINLCAEPQPKKADEFPAVVICLLKGVVYQDSDPALWASLFRLQSRVREYVAALNLELTLDEPEGYAYLRMKPQESDDKNSIPRLIARRPLSFPVSLLLALLRKKLAEFDAHGGETRLILSRDEIVGLIKVFMPASNNEAQLMTRVDTHINKIVDMGFLRKMKAGSHYEEAFEVKRILKAFVDAQWLSDFEQRLAQYETKLTSPIDDRN